MGAAVLALVLCDCSGSVQASGSLDLGRSGCRAQRDGRTMDGSGVVSVAWRSLVVKWIAEQSGSGLSAGDSDCLRTRRDVARASIVGEPCPTLEGRKQARSGSQPAIFRLRTFYGGFRQSGLG